MMAAPDLSRLQHAITITIQMAQPGPVPPEKDDMRQRLLDAIQRQKEQATFNSKGRMRTVPGVQHVGGG